MEAEPNTQVQGKVLKNEIQYFQCLDMYSKLEAQKLVKNPQQSSDSTWIWRANQESKLSPQLVLRIVVDGVYSDKESERVKTED